jgi:hypothetical protein
MVLLKTILAIIVGFAVGSAVNMGLITIGGLAVAPPPGIDLADMEALKAAMPTLGPKYFLFPFLAHALGTLVGALVAYLIAPRENPWPAWVIGIMFLAGGIAASFMIPAPKMFIAADLVLAYLPMAWLGIKAGGVIRRKNLNGGIA